jgi:hypothetical protein
VIETGDLQVWQFIKFGCRQEILICFEGQQVRQTVQWIDVLQTVACEVDVTEVDELG